MKRRKYNILNFPVAYIPLLYTSTQYAAQMSIYYGVGYYLVQHGESITLETIERAYDFFNLKVAKGTFKERAEIIKKALDAFARPPITFIHTDMLKEFNDHFRNEFDIMALALLLALRSIGSREKDVNYTNMAMIAARMSGHAAPGEPIHDQVQKWLTRRKFEQLKSYLANRKLMFFARGKTRGVCFSSLPIIRR